MNKSRKIDIEIINQLFKDLNEVTGIENIAFHKFVDEELSPVHMMGTKTLKTEDWKEVHSKNPVRILEDPVLKKVVKGEIVFINDTINDKESSPEFEYFGIKSIAVFPLFKESEVCGIIVIPSIGTKFEFCSEIIGKCKELIESFNKNSM